MPDSSSKPYKGQITVFAGPMFAGKSTRLLDVAEQLIRCRREFKAFKPSIDNRYSVNDITTHKQSKLECRLIENSCDIEAAPNVLIDEAQFLDHDAPKVVRDLAQQGSNVYIAGLNIDSFGNPFGPMPNLMAIADLVVHLVTICEVCGVYDAKYTYRKNKSTEQTAVGGSDKYGPRCIRCWSN